MTTILIVGTILIALLSLALWHCYKTNKPLREKAREQAEAMAREKARQDAQIADQMRREGQREEVFADLEMALNDPHRYLSGSVTHSMGQARWKYKNLADLVQALATYKSFQADHEGQRHRIEKQSQLLREQREQIKALQANLEDVQRALRMGVVIE